MRINTHTHTTTNESWATHKRKKTCGYCIRMNILKKNFLQKKKNNTTTLDNNEKKKFKRLFFSFFFFGFFFSSSFFLFFAFSKKWWCSKFRFFLFFYFFSATFTTTCTIWWDLNKIIKIRRCYHHAWVNQCDNQIPLKQHLCTDQTLCSNHCSRWWNNWML
jgi:hypothetical protein